jgi:hypothetical protein
MASPVGRAQLAYQLPLKVPSVRDSRRIGEPIRRLRAKVSALRFSCLMQAVSLSGQRR